MCIKSIVYRSFSCSQMRRVFELKCEWLVKKQSFLKLWTFLKFFVLSSFSCTNSYIQKNPFWSFARFLLGNFSNFKFNLFYKAMNSRFSRFFLFFSKKRQETEITRARKMNLNPNLDTEIEKNETDQLSNKDRWRPAKV